MARTAKDAHSGVLTCSSSKEDDHNVDQPPTNPMGWTSDNASVLSGGWDV
ncbi:MAG: hypothetical protein U0163_01760 [Gemmatimonadaceae bacterium]